MKKLDEPLKRTIIMPDLLPDRDAERLVFPNGIVSKLRSQSGGELARRIEILAEEENEVYGLSHDMFVTYASESKILEMARRSNFVVEIRGLRSRPRGQGSEGGYFKDRLIVKQLNASDIGRRDNSLFVPRTWLDRVSGEEGQHALVSNTLTDFVLPPPSSI